MSRHISGSRISGRRAERRRYAILGALTEHGPAKEYELARHLGRRLIPLMLDLFRLQDAGRIIAEPVDVDGGYVIVHRLPTDDERAERMMRIAQFEDRIRNALQAAANQIGDEPR